MQKWKRTLALVLALCLLATVCPLTAMATEPAQVQRLYATEVTGALPADLQAALLEENLEQENLMEMDMPAPWQTVRVIVALEGQGMASAQRTAKMEDLSAAQFLSSQTGRELLEEATLAQDRVLSALKEQDIEAEVGCRYTSLFNGLSLDVRYGDVEAIRKIPGVRTVALSAQWQKEETTLEQAAAQVMEHLANTTEYLGQNMVIGIVDTGLDYDHEAFANQPEQARMTQQDVEDLLYFTRDGELYANTYAALWYYQKTGEQLTSDQLYHSQKVPFAFDYADADDEVKPSREAVESLGNDHGTHVAGIAAGKTVDEQGSVTFSGVAPEAQLAIFKVFSDKSASATTDHIMAALSDAWRMGVDVINMSLGAAGGFATEEGNALVQECYDVLAESGITLCCSAGNAYSSTYSGAAGDFPLTGNPDSGIVSSSSSYAAALSVASINSKGTAAFQVNGVSVAYNSVSGHDFAKELGDGTYAYVMVPGAGELTDYAGLDVTGRIAVIRRGDLSFEQKQLNAQTMGAAACIIYNNRAGYPLNMSVENYQIPTCAVSMEDGMWMEQQENKSLMISADAQTALEMSDFSSWGPLPSLALKPEITAPGGDIYSSLPYDNSYGTMSGTSMASPYLAGVAAALKSYYKPMYAAYSANELDTLLSRIMMSTAQIVKDPQNVPYSPRKQGAGLVDLDAAMRTPAYLYVSGTDRAKLELGDDPYRTGIYELTFHVKNDSYQAVRYDVSTLVQTESVTPDGKNIAQKGYPLNAVSQLRVSGGALSGNTLTVSGQKDATVTVTLTLTAADRTYLNQNFENGIYVEGFVCLDSKDEGGVDLSIPYLAFYGDWTEAPAMDAEAFDAEGAVVAPTEVIGAIYNSFTGGLNGYYLGNYMFALPEGYTAPARTKEKLAMKLAPTTSDYAMTDGFNSLYYLSLGLLRGAKTVDVTIADKDTGEVYVNTTDINVRKSRYNSSSGAIVNPYVGPVFPGPQGYSRLPGNTTVTYTAKANLDAPEPQNNKRDEFCFDLLVDTEAPYLVNRDSLGLREENGRYYVDVTFSDNHYLMCASLYSASNLYGGLVPTANLYPYRNYYAYMTPFCTKDGVDVEPNTEKTLTFDVTDFCQNFYEGKFFVIAYDYALNLCCYEVSTQYEPVESLTLSDTAKTLKTNEVAQLTASLEPVIATNRAVVWTSSDDSVVLVKDGELTGRKAGTATITATSADNPKASASCVVTVLEEALDPIQPTAIVLEPTSLSLSVGVRETLTATLEPYNATMRTISWSSSNEQVATVENGTVLGVAAGSAVITAKLENGLQATCDVTVSVPVGNFVIEGTVLTGYTGSDASVEIPDGVTEIADKVFYKNTTIKSVTMPDSVKVLGDSVFEGCTALQSVRFPETMTSWGKRMFFGCTNLANATIPAGLTEIPERAFQNCKKITDLPIPASVTTVGQYAFYGCTGLTALVIPDSVTTLHTGGSQWNGCTGLTSVTIGAGLQTLPGNCFYGTTNLTAITIPETITSLGNAVFQGSGLKEFTGHDKLTKVGSNVLRMCKSLTKVTFLAPAVTLSGSGAFYGCSALTEINGAFTSIPSNTFSATGIGPYTVPDSVESIGANAFSNCPNMTKLTIGKDSKLTMGEFSLTSASKLNVAPNMMGINAAFQGVQVDPAHPALSSDDNGYLYNKEGTRLIMAYSTVQKAVLPDTVEQIGYYAFVDNDNIQELVMPDRLTHIGSYAFYGADHLVKLDFGKGLQEIGEKAFYCNYHTSYDTETRVIESLVFPDSLVRIGASAFEGAVWKTTSMQFGSGLQTIGERAFYNCQDVSAIVLPSSMQSIGNYAFYNCRSAKTIDVGGTKTIGNYAFMNVKSTPGIVSSLKLSANLQSIGNYAFTACGALAEVNWADATSLEKIGTNAFQYNVSLTNLDLSATKLTEIGDYAFENAGKVTVVALPDTIVKVGRSAFSGAGSELESWTNPILAVPDSLNNLSCAAFEGATNLQGFSVKESNPNFVVDAAGALLNKETGALEVWPCGSLTTNYTIPEGTKTIGIHAFYGSKNLQELTVASSVTSTNGSSISNCPNLERVIFLDSKNGLEGGNYMLSENPKLTYVRLPNGMTKLGLRTFENDVSLREIELPGTLTTIGSFLFNGCTGLETVRIGEGVTQITWSMLKNCKEVKHVTIPSSVSYIETDPRYLPFLGCTSLENITVDGRNRYYKDIDGVLMTADGSTLIYYPEGKQAAAYQIPEGTVRIASNAFYNNLNLQEVTLPESLKRVGDLAFFGAENLLTYHFRSMEAPALECNTYYSGTRQQLGRYGNFMDYYFTIVDGEPVFRDPWLCMTVPEGATGYDTHVWKAFFKETTQIPMQFTITKQPESYVGLANDMVQFSIETNRENVTYQWQFSNTQGRTWANSGAAGNDTANLSVQLLAYRDGQQYRCVATDAEGNTLISEPAVMRLEKHEIVLIRQPADVQGKPNETAVFSVAAMGEGLQYQWQYSNTQGRTWAASGSAGSDTPNLSVVLQSYRNGQMYRCRIWDAYGNVVYTDAVTMTVVK